MISNQIPKKNIPLFPAIRSEMKYNIGTPGKYSFPTNTNINIKLLDLEKNSVYLFDKFSFSANLAEEDFLSSLDALKSITMNIVKKQGNENFFKYPTNLINYHTNTEMNFFLETNQSDDQVLITLNGELFQIADTVGLGVITLNISFQVYQIDNTVWNDYYRDVTLVQRQKYE